ncbi:XVIPCD domain-containing protein [Lysobacter sp. 1R34A]|uniref:XVIPCD domain-containing protein n=1 Tax=Lysobacter sp. 1R34A TaxID=3445786 RepID=UPI003EEB50B0
MIPSEVLFKWLEMLKGYPEHLARLQEAGRTHPDHALYEKVRGAVEQLDRHVGMPWDQQSERMTASALALAVEKKFDPKEDIRLVFNQPTANLAPSEMVHVYRVGHAVPTRPRTSPA